VSCALLLDWLAGGTRAYCHTAPLASAARALEDHEHAGDDEDVTDADDTVGIGLLRGREEEPKIGAGRDGATGAAWRLACPSRVSRVLAAVRRPGGGRFGIAELVSGCDRRAAAPTVALNATGRPVVLWVVTRR
jgi:hypothetical protein